jgi:hypothetical protein
MRLIICREFGPSIQQICANKLLDHELIVVGASASNRGLLHKSSSGSTKKMLQDQLDDAELAFIDTTDSATTTTTTTTTTATATATTDATAASIVPDFSDQAAPASAVPLPESGTARPQLTSSGSLTSLSISSLVALESKLLSVGEASIKLPPPELIDIPSCSWYRNLSDHFPHLREFSVTPTEAVRVWLHKHYTQRQRSKVDAGANVFVLDCWQNISLGLRLIQTNRSERAQGRDAIIDPFANKKHLGMSHKPGTDWVMLSEC